MTKQTQLEQNKLVWIESIKKGNPKALNLLYRVYRKEFVNWICKKTGCNQETALDIFQESVFALYKNAKAGRIDDIKSTIKTYLFTIGKRCYMYQNRKDRLEIDSLEENESILEKLIIVPNNSKSLTDRQQLVSTFLSRLRPICQDILTMFYYENLSMKVIAERQNYRSVNVAKVMKARCMKSLRKLVQGQKGK